MKNIFFVALLVNSLLSAMNHISQKHVDPDNVKLEWHTNGNPHRDQYLEKTLYAKLKTITGFFSQQEDTQLLGYIKTTESTSGCEQYRNELICDKIHSFRVSDDICNKDNIRFLLFKEMATMCLNKTGKIAGNLPTEEMDSINFLKKMNAKVKCDSGYCTFTYEAPQKEIKF